MWNKALRSLVLRSELILWSIRSALLATVGVHLQTRDFKQDQENARYIICDDIWTVRPCSGERWVCTLNNKITFLIMQHILFICIWISILKTETERGTSRSLKMPRLNQRGRYFLSLMTWNGSSNINEFGVMTTVRKLSSWQEPELISVL